ncbi:MAG: response regulator transcription factor [Ignavibacteriaceae bacterium]|nr:response regulator transcription factor [Ignavibacteriaceae bacterium]
MQAVKNYTVLLVDDSHIVQKAFSALLNDFKGIKVVCAFSGEEALDIFNRFTPELTVLDIQLPGINGLELLKRIKLNHPEAKVIVNTNNPSSAYRNRALNLGCSMFIDKSKEFTNILNFIDVELKMLKSKGVELL